MLNLVDYLQQAAVSLRGQGTMGEWTRGRLVVPGQILIATQEARRLKFAVGDGIKRNDNNFIASRHGFLWLQAAAIAHAIMPNAKAEIRLTLAILPLVEISDDAMEAWLNLIPPDDDRDLIDFSGLMQRIRACGLVYGVNQDAIRSCHELVLRQNIPVTAHLIAFGKAVVPGSDAMIRMEVETGPLPGMLLHDGRMDFRERRVFVAVQKGQILAVKIPATSGTNGVNVRGEEIASPHGADISIATSDLCVFNPDDGAIRATGDGILSVVGGNAFRVSDKHDIAGDVDFTTGNIRFHGNIEVTGSVQPGFTVASRGDIKIGGIVQSATVNSHGNVVVVGGVVGPTSNIRAEGDIDVKFIERGKAACGGSFYLRGSAYYSDVAVEGDIIGGVGSRIVGGDVRCGGSITVESVGSPVTSDTVLSAGLHLCQWRRALDIRARIDELVDIIDKLVQFRGEKHLDCEAYASLEEELIAERRELDSINLAYGGSQDLIGITGEWCTRAEIRVAGVLRAGVRLRLGNAEMVAERDYSASRFFQDANNNRLVVVPL